MSLAYKRFFDFLFFACFFDFECLDFLLFPFFTIELFVSSFDEDGKKLFIVAQLVPRRENVKTKVMI